VGLPIPSSISTEFDFVTLLRIFANDRLKSAYLIDGDKFNKLYTWFPFDAKRYNPVRVAQDIMLENIGETLVGKDDL